jgi:hypothetical protein
VKDVLLVILKGLFDLAKLWWVWLVIVVLLGLFNVDELLKLAEAAAGIVGKAKGQ